LCFTHSFLTFVEARAKGILIKIRAAKGVLSLTDNDVVLGDKFKLDQVLRNLISNALKYSFRNSTVSVRVGFCPTKTVPSPPIASSSRPERNSTSYPRQIIEMIAGSSRVQHSNSGSNTRERSTGSVRARFMPRLSRPVRVQNNNSNMEHVLPSSDDNNDKEVIGELLVVVTDHGVGISKENQKLLFQEGMQFDAENLHTGGGSGFGEHTLSI
jgi:signal transduction histidine kinase